MGHYLRCLSRFAHVLALLVAVTTVFAAPAQAAEPDLPLAAASPMAGIEFDDKPLFLPVQKNFQLAMMTAGNEIGRSCGKTEAYGWRLGQAEQTRADRIFNATVERFRGMGYEVKTEAPGSVSRDITLFTADRTDKHFLAMWSAGEIGLVMVLCETGGRHGGRLATPASRAAQTPAPAQSSVEVYAAPDAPPGKTDYDGFTPLGVWTGNYVCEQGYTGGALTISKLHDGNFEGDFHFYATARNPDVPDGRYTVYGQYDRASQRILINPGHWLKRPANYYNTILVGSFDPATQTLSAYFQGINGCTSFEARRKRMPVIARPALKHHKHAAKPKKAALSLTAPKAAATDPVPAATQNVPAPAAATGDDNPSGLVTVTLPDPAKPAAAPKPPLEVGAPTTGAGGTPVTPPPPGK